MLEDSQLFLGTAFQVTALTLKLFSLELQIAKLVICVSLYLIYIPKVLLLTKISVFLDRINVVVIFIFTLMMLYVALMLNLLISQSCLHMSSIKRITCITFSLVLMFDLNFNV